MPERHSIRVPLPRSTAANLVILEAIRILQARGISGHDFQIQTILSDEHSVTYLLIE